MRRFGLYLLIAAFLAVTVLPDEHVAHHTVESVVETTAAGGVSIAAGVARTAGEVYARAERGAASEGRRPVLRTERRPGGRAALTDRLIAQVDRRADEVALAAPARAEQSLSGLAAYLKREAGPTMRGRTRAVFRWVASKVRYDTDLAKAERLVRPTQAPATVLEEREAVCEGYARLFVELAERTGLEAAYIEGEADPAGPGGGGRHAWAAVKLADGWYLLDPTWAAGYVGPTGAFFADFNTEWWLVAPSRFEQTHAPDAAAWLLTRGGEG